ncbi:MAG: DUF2744 domain-containing protein [Dietzia sp.]
MALPVQEFCDPADPREHLLWTFLGLAEVGAPMLIPEDALRRLSAQMYAAGVRHHPEFQTIRYLPPPGVTHLSWMSAAAAGEWVPVDDPRFAEQPAPTEPVDTSKWSAAQKIAVAQQLRDDGVIR